MEWQCGGLLQTWSSEAEGEGNILLYSLVVLESIIFPSPSSNPLDAGECSYYA